METIPLSKPKNDNDIPKESKTRVFFPNLDSLRFFAFFAVFTSHTFAHFGLKQNTFIEKLVFVIPTLNDQSGPLGVRFFFVLSGFLITYLLFVEKRNNNNRNIDIKAFYIRRLLRIWPLYFVAVAFGFLVFPFISKLFLGEFYFENANPWNHIFFLGNFDMLWNGKPTGVPLGLLWSLSVEEQFYLFWPVLFLLIGPVRKNSFLVAFIVLFLISVIFQFYHRADKWTNYFHSLSCMGSLVIGGILAYASIYISSVKRWFHNLPMPIILSVYGGGFTMIYLIFYVANDTIMVLYSIAASLFFGFIIMEQNFSKNSFFKFGRISSFSYLGKISFGLYVLHPVAIFITDHVFPTQYFSFAWFILQIIAALSFSILLAYISYRFLEKPFLKFKSKFAR
jgi:peptidoglycan/LPS O-acetylase OafA/YrhL